MNRIKAQKKQISETKFNRLFAQNLDQAGVAYISKNWEIINSIQSVKIGSYIYAKFPCKNQGSNRLKVYCIRYDSENPLDFVMHKNYPASVFSPVTEF